MRERKAFTLIELLVVISIIGVLSTLSVVALTYARNQAKIGKAQHDVDAIASAVKLLESDTGQWPGHQEVDAVTSSGANEIWDLNGADAGVIQTDGNFPGWNGPYMGMVRLDPWGNNYFWDSDYLVGGNPMIVVGSFGPNGIGQNVYDSDNIYKVLR